MSTIRLSSSSVALGIFYILISGFIFLAVLVEDYQSFYDTSIISKLIYYKSMLLISTIFLLVPLFFYIRVVVLRKALFFFLGFTPFICTIVLSSAYSLDPQSVAVSSLLFAILLFFIAALAMFEEDLKSVHYFGCFLLLAANMIPVLVNGFGGESGRMLGGVAANTAAKYILCFCLLSYLTSDKRVLVCSVLVTIYMLILYQSRGTFLSLLVFLSLPGIVVMVEKKIFSIVMLTLLFVLVVVTSSIFLGEAELFGNISGIENRQIGNDYSGRLEYWRIGWGLFLDRPFFGYGFLTRGSVEANDYLYTSAHSGFLNMLIDVGGIGFLLFFVPVSYCLFISTMILIKLKNVDMVFPFAATISVFLLWVYEPFYLNLGHPLTYVFIYNLARVYHLNCLFFSKAY